MKPSGLGRVTLVLSGLGFPLTQAAIARFGRRGAIVVEGVCAGFLIRDAALIALGTPRRLRRGPAALLWLEALVAAAASVASMAPILSPAALRHAVEPRPATTSEAVRRISVGALFGLHTWRFRIYLGQDRGRRPVPELAAIEPVGH